MASVKLTLCLLLFGLTAKAQTFGEWFDQQNTRRKYLIQQIAAFEAYGVVLKTGYKVAHHGLGSIGNSAHSELGLHSAYYHGLQDGSIVVASNPLVKDILMWQQDIMHAFKQIGEDPYYRQVKAAVLKDCAAQLTELQQISNDRSLQMGEAERIAGINKIHDAMRSDYRFTLGFCEQIQTLNMQKQQEAHDTEILKHFYENH